MLAGKDKDTSKFKTAVKNQAEFINLRRLQKLLLGQLTFESTKQLEKLTKASFKGNACEAGGAPPAAAEPTNALSH